MSKCKMFKFWNIQWISMDMGIPEFRNSGIPGIEERALPLSWYGAAGEKKFLAVLEKKYL